MAGNVYLKVAASGSGVLDNIVGHLWKTGFLTPCVLSQRALIPPANNSLRQSVRFKGIAMQVYCQRRGFPPRKKHIGVRALSAEYVDPNRLLVRQRKHYPFNLSTRKRHYRIYPGENVTVDSYSSLYSTTFGRVKFTHDVSRDVLICNVLPEVREDLRSDDLWRYRTEHVRSMEENRNLCWLRTKAGTVFAKENIKNPPRKPPPCSRKLRYADHWEHPDYADVRPSYAGYRRPR